MNQFHLVDSVDNAFTEKSFRNPLSQPQGLEQKAYGKTFLKTLSFGKCWAAQILFRGRTSVDSPVLGKRLFDAAQPPKHWVVIEGGHHSDLQDVGALAYQAALAQFKAQLLAVP